MSVPVKILPHYTYDDYVHWEGKWEVIHGIPYAMSPAPIPRHQKIATGLSIALGTALRQECKKCTLYQPIDYLVADDTILQPDLLIVCQDIPRKFLDFRPELVVEILSPSTALKDRHTKFGLYEKEKIPYYLIVSADINEIEVYKFTGQSYEMVTKGNSFSFTFQFAGCQVPVSFIDIWE